MYPMRNPPDDYELTRLIDHGVSLLKLFHLEHERNPFCAATEFRRGRVSEWRHLLAEIYGRNQADVISLVAGTAAGLTIPHCGPLAEDGNGYMGFDSGCQVAIYTSGGLNPNDCEI